MKVLFGILVLCCLLAGFFFGEDISISEQLKLLQSLKDFASIVFGIMGAWVAIVYPDSLKKVFSRSENIDNLNDRLTRLFFPLRVSLIIVVACLVYPWVYAVVKNYPALVAYRDLIRMINFSIGTFMLSMTLISLLFTFINIDDTHKNVVDTDKHLKSVERRSGRNSRKSKP